MGGMGCLRGERKGGDNREVGGEGVDMSECDLPGALWLGPVGSNFRTASVPKRLGTAGEQ